MLASQLLARHLPPYFATGPVADVVKRRAPRPRPASAHAIDEAYFDRIDTPEKAYILGFITADGCIHHHPPSVSLELGGKDIDHLARLRDILAPTVQIRPHPVRCNGRDIMQFRLTICSVRWVAALERLGVRAAKSLTVQPAELREELMPAYWRGVVDGDGSVFWSRSVGWGLSLTGSLPMALGLQGFLARAGVESRSTVRRDKGAWRYEIGGHDLVRTALRVLYPRGPRELSLGRKAAAAEVVCALPGRFDASRAASPEAIARLRQQGLSSADIAAELGISRTTLWCKEQANTSTGRDDDNSRPQGRA